MHSFCLCLLHSNEQEMSVTQDYYFQNLTRLPFTIALTIYVTMFNNKKSLVYETEDSKDLLSHQEKRSYFTYAIPNHNQQRTTVYIIPVTDAERPFGGKRKLIQQTIF